MLRMFAVMFPASLALLVGLPRSRMPTRRLVDGQGDMWDDHYTGDRPVPAPNQERVDFRRAIVTHTERIILVRARFTELQRAGISLELAVRIRTNTGSVRFAFIVAGNRRQADAGWRGYSYLVRRSGREAPCAVTHRLDYAGNVARLRIPRSCMRTPRWIQATVVARWASGGRRFRFLRDNPHN